jgi:hypothetical protein
MKLESATASFVARNAWASRLLCLALSVLACLSCGNDVRLGKGNSSSSSGVFYGADANLTSNSTSVGEFTCPNQPNVFPSNDGNVNNAGQFTVCTSSAANNKVMIEGTPISSSTLCFFPIQRVDSNHIYFIPDPSTGLPTFQCSSGTSNQWIEQFSGGTFNALFVVDSTDESSMQNCLALAETYACPTYSYGSFR